MMASRAALLGACLALASRSAYASSGVQDNKLPVEGPPTDAMRVVWGVAIVTTVLGWALSAKAIVGHYRWFNHPKIQTYITRLLWTMPIYGACGLFSIIFPNTIVTWILIRNCWNAFMVYNFIELIVAYFSPHEKYETRVKNMITVLERMDKVRAKPPCCCCGVIHPGEHFLLDQVIFPSKVFAVAAPLFAVVGELVSSYNAYGFGAQDVTFGWFWLNILTMLCTMWALAGLFMIYQVVEHHIPSIKMQNTCIHIVLGPMVIQEVVLGILGATDSLGSVFGLPNSQISGVILVNFLYCIESLVFGYLWTRAFDYKVFCDMDHQTFKFHSASEEGFITLEGINSERRASVIEAPKSARFSMLAGVTPHLRDADTADAGDVELGLADSKQEEGEDSTAAAADDATPATAADTDEGTGSQAEPDKAGLIANAETGAANLE